jgi:hypothetical protein
MRIGFVPAQQTLYGDDDHDAKFSHKYPFVEENTFGCDEAFFDE